MSQVIRIPQHVYKRLGSHAVGFDTPAGVIEKILDFYEANNIKETALFKDNFSKSSFATSFDMESRNQSRPINKGPKVYSSIARGRFTRDLGNQNYTLTSPEGVSETFKLPDVNDKRAIRELTHQVEEFVRKHGGTEGQIKAARKKLTEFGYHITK